MNVVITIGTRVAHASDHTVGIGTVVGNAGGWMFPFVVVWDTIPNYPGLYRASDLVVETEA